MLSQATVEWILRRGDHDVTCTRHQTERGIELKVTFRGLPVAAYVTAAVEHADAWVHSRLESWQEMGYEMTPRRTA